MALLEPANDEVQQECPSPLAHTQGTDVTQAMRPDPDSIIRADTWRSE